MSKTEVTNHYIPITNYYSYNKSLCIVRDESWKEEVVFDDITNYIADISKNYENCEKLSVFINFKCLNLSQENSFTKLCLTHVPNELFLKEEMKVTVMYLKNNDVVNFLDMFYNCNPFSQKIKFKHCKINMSGFKNFVKSGKMAELENYKIDFVYCRFILDEPRTNVFIQNIIEILSNPKSYFLSNHNSTVEQVMSNFYQIESNNLEICNQFEEFSNINFTDCN